MNRKTELEVVFAAIWIKQISRLYISIAMGL